MDPSSLEPAFPEALWGYKYVAPIKIKSKLDCLMTGFRVKNKDASILGPLVLPDLQGLHFLICKVGRLMCFSHGVRIS